jgi:hypothetical protein
MRTIAYRRTGITISETVPKDFEIEQAKQFTDLGYGSQRKDIIDEGFTPMRTTQKGADENSNEMNGHENWTKNGKPNRNDHMDETEIIILKKRRSNTERIMTPGGETHFLMQVPTASPREHREGGDGWIEPEEMRRSLVELLDENIRNLSGTQ